MIKKIMVVMLACLAHVTLAGVSSDFLVYIRNPLICAFLDTIAYAEGTFYQNGYRCVFGGSHFNDFFDHPRRVICALSRGKPLCSTAAGRYQFCRKTWDEVADKMGAKDFSPFYQDCATNYLLNKVGALGCTKEGHFLLEDFLSALKKINRIWASIPGAPYEQPVKEELELYIFFLGRFAYYQRILQGE